ncbi:MAG: ISL3 family transposase [Acidobacteria bacterium]|nr:MAG: ISL3 family transposase [Acidobacteriota bacterium]
MAVDSMNIRLRISGVRVLDVDDQDNQLSVEVASISSVSRCPWCGWKTNKVHEVKRTKVRDLPYGGRQATLIWHRRRFSCANCSERHTECHPQFVGTRRLVTRRLQTTATREARESTISAVSRRYFLCWALVMAWVKTAAEIAAKRRRAKAPKVLLIDEKSMRKGSHRYMTVFSDGESGAVIAMIRGRTSLQVGTWLAERGPKWCKGVDVVVTDMSSSYRAAIRRHLSGATHVVDRFHVVRLVLGARTEVRRRIQRRGPKGTRPAFEPEVFATRYLTAKRADHLTSKEAEAVARVLGRYPELARAWEVVQRFHRFYEAGDETAADSALDDWAIHMTENPIAEFRTVIKTLAAWADEIVAFHEVDRRTNGPLEGRMAKVEVLKRTAYGFKNPDNFAARTLLISPAAA